MRQAGRSKKKKKTTAERIPNTRRNEETARGRLRFQKRADSIQMNTGLFQQVQNNSLQQTPHLNSPTVTNKDTKKHTRHKRKRRFSRPRDAEDDTVLFRRDGALASEKHPTGRTDSERTAGGTSKEEPRNENLPARSGGEQPNATGSAPRTGIYAVTRSRSFTHHVYTCSGSAELKISYIYRAVSGSGSKSPTCGNDMFPQLHPINKRRAESPCDSLTAPRCHVIK